MAAPVDQYVSVTEASRVLRLSDGRIRKLIASKKLKGVKPVGMNAWLISRDELQRFQKLDRPPGNPNFSAKKRSPRKRK